MQETAWPGAALAVPGLTDDDRAWVQRHLILAGWHPPEPGMKPPVVDLSWITMTTVRW